jgi:DNA transposition AAA+ family ATPase
MRLLIRESRYGKEEAEKYKDLIQSKLSGKRISKRRDLGDHKGGLVYEADKLGIDTFDLLRALEGMCYLGLVEEIDDSTYLVL